MAGFRLLVVALLILAAGGRLSARDRVGLPLVSVYASDEIGSDAISFSAIQHSSGVLFFGGNALLSFDGDRWRSAPLPTGYGIRGLDFGPDGRLWLGAVGELGWFDDPTGLHPQFHSLRGHLPADGLPLGQVWRAFAEGNGAIFVTADQILRWRDGRFQAWRYPNQNRLRAMRVNGTVFVDDPTTGLLVVRADGPRVFIPRSALGEGDVYWIDARTDGWLLATHRGLLMLRDGGLTPFAASVSQLLIRDALTCGARLADGRYAFGTFRGGIVVMNHDGSLDQEMRDDVLPTRSITSLLVDRDGDLWATSRSAVFRVEPGSDTTVFDGRAGLPEQAYRSIARLGRRLVLGTERGVYELARDRRSFALAPGLQESVHDVTVAGDQLIATGLGWAKRLDDAGTAEIVYRAPADVFTVATSARHPGARYYSDSRSIVRQSPSGATFECVQDLPEIVRSIDEDEAGNLWFATISEGVLFATPRPDAAVTARSVPAEFGLPALQGRTLLRMAADGAILVFADNGGWLKPAGAQRFRAIEHAPARTPAAASAIAADGTAWVAYPATDRLASCVGRILIHGESARWEPHSLSGLATVGLPRCLLTETTAEGRTVLWLGGTRAVLRHVVAGGPVAPSPRPPVLRVFAYQAENDAPHLITAPLSYATQRVDFEFAAPEFARRGSLRLETRIAGVDQDWVPAADGRRQLTALRDGVYAFQVRSVAETGRASEPTVFKFEVLPPWWRTPRFVLCATLALLPLGYGTYLWRIRRLRRQNAQLEAKVRERTEELIQANAAKTQFVANISHDIRNPLNGIVGLALALEDTPLDDRQTELVATLRECTTYLSSLVDDVLDFASIEAGRVELRPQRYVASELLRSIAETMKTDTAASGARLTLVVDPEVPADLQGDTGRIQQILVNFVSNALKYAGGEITLSVALPAGEPGEVEFAVTDRGPGIAAEQQARLFTKFTRLRPTHGNERIPGTGLGLAACRLLADIMGGSVGLQSSAGDGARFFLRLPLTIATAPAEPAPSDLPNTTVLLVEDTDYNAWAARAVLARLGLACERARTGAEALELFAAKRFNVVLLDRNLPDMDGTEVARRIRELEADGLPAVLLAVTAYCTAEDRAHCLQAGMDAFVGKPLTPDKLRKALLAAGRRQLVAATLQAAPTAPASDLDLDMLTYLSDGSASGLQQQVARFIETLHEGAERLRAAEQAGNPAELANAAHAICGQARMVGGASLAEAAAELERAARASQPCSSALTRVRTELQSLTAAMLRRRPAGRSK